ncbi:MAG: type I-E CRISPR-associated protein Cas7/Cse4/CasC [Spirochaetia bacterium]|nr:type I-E CRISPR-associated protein Cas7/Cse4/CasC [Spirochaetia bacterium]
MDNKFKGLYVEYHILQSFPVTCLNRDDVGAPKSAIVGGVPRARVSSQSWKRAVRQQMHDFGMNIGIRTKCMQKIIYEKCIELGAKEALALNCSKFASELYVKKIDTDGYSDVLVFITQKEAMAISEYMKSINFDTNQIDKTKLKKIIKNNVCSVSDGLDIALFGRMVAKDQDLNLEAASSFAHAISTHKVVSEIDFFTALDDLADKQGSAHMGSLEFNSATYYRYISINLGQLYDTLNGEGIIEAIEKFTKSLYLAIPSARQSTQSGSCFWDFARVYIRKGQRLQVPFDKAVTKAFDGGYLEESKKILCGYLDKKEKLSGSLFGLKYKADYGDDENFSIDDLCSDLTTSILKE